MAITAEARKATQTRATLMPMSPQIVGCRRTGRPRRRRTARGEGRNCGCTKPSSVTAVQASEHDREGTDADPELDRAGPPAEPKHEQVAPRPRRRRGRRRARRAASRRLRRASSARHAAAATSPATWLITERSMWSSGRSFVVGRAELEIEVHRLAEHLVDAALLVGRADQLDRLVERRVAEVRQRRLEVVRRDRELLGDDRDRLLLVGVEVVDRPVDRAQELDVFVGMRLQLVGVRP